MTRHSTKVAVEEDYFDPATQEIRLRALQRLYVRREAVEELIRSLEVYQESDLKKTPVIPINAARMCW